MTITINKQEDRLVAAVSGDLDNAASTQAERDLAPVLECTDRDIVIDCTKLEYIASSGLRILISILKGAKAGGSKVVLKNMNDDIKSVFKLTGFINIFEVE